VDDNSALIAFGGNKIGLMWSNQSSSNYAMWFAVHQDGSSDTTWSAAEQALAGSSMADDHINLKSDSSGRVFAATKTSNTSSTSPLVMLLVRSSSGVWSRHPIAQVSDCPNRPLVLIDEQNSIIHTFYTAPGPPNYTCTSSGGAIYKKTSSISSVSFPTGRGTPVIVDADSPFSHDVSSMKRNVNGVTGLAALAVNNSTRNYWHHYETLGAPPTPPPAEPPVANFSGSPTTGTAPLTVAFTDSSTGTPTSWAWTFGDGSTSTAQNPSHTYTVAGTYSVTLTATNAYGSASITKTDYITVTPPPPDFSISVSPSKQTVHRGGSASYAVTVAPTNGFTGQVTLSVSGQRAGVTTSFSQNPLTVSTPASATLFVTTTTLTKQGGNTLTITASSGTLTHATTVTLLIKR
jgi:PKD repeat protein